MKKQTIEVRFLSDRFLKWVRINFTLTPIIWPQLFQLFLWPQLFPIILLTPIILTPIIPNLAGYKGKRVKVTISQGQQFDGAGNVMGTMDAFKKIQVME